MARQTLNNGESGAVIRGKINANFIEAYAASAPVRLRANQWYTPNLGGNLSAGTAVPINVMRFIPFIVRETCTVSQLGVRITTLGAGNVQLAIYAADTVTGLPTGNPLGTTPSIPTTAVGTTSAALAAAVQLTPGLYWLAMNTDNATAVYQVNGGNSLFLGFLMGGSTIAAISASATTAFTHLTITQTFGTWPDVTALTPTSAATTTYAIIFPFVSSVP